VFTARYALSPYIKQIHFSNQEFKTRMKQWSWGDLSFGGGMVWWKIWGSWGSKDGGWLQWRCCWLQQTLSQSWNPLSTEPHTPNVHIAWRRLKTKRRDKSSNKRVIRSHRVNQRDTGEIEAGSVYNVIVPATCDTYSVHNKAKLSLDTI
jgi:hypothetical protein